MYTKGRLACTRGCFGTGEEELYWRVVKGSEDKVAEEEVVTVA